jgi:hypothetical protein
MTTGSISYGISKGGTQLVPLLRGLSFLSFRGFCKFPFLFDESNEFLTINSFFGVLVWFVDICWDVLTSERPPGLQQGLRDGSFEESIGC